MLGGRVGTGLGVRLGGGDAVAVGVGDGGNCVGVDDAAAVNVGDGRILVGAGIADCVGLAGGLIDGVGEADGLADGIGDGVVDGVSVEVGSTGGVGGGVGGSLMGKNATAAAFSGRGGSANGTLKTPGVGVDSGVLIRLDGTITASSGDAMRHTSSAIPPPKQIKPNSAIPMPRTSARRESSAITGQCFV